MALDAIDACSEAHQRDPRNAHILRDRAEAYILNQDYEKGNGSVNNHNNITVISGLICDKCDIIKLSFHFSCGGLSRGTRV